MIFLPKIIDKLKARRDSVADDLVIVRLKFDAFLKQLEANYQFFDFGSFDYRKVTENDEFATDRFERGLLRLPFENCAFQYNPMIENISENSMIFISETAVGGFTAFMIMERKIEIPLYYIEVFREGVINMETFKYFGRDGIRYAERLIAGRSDLQELANDICIKIIGLTTLLNTRAAISEYQEADKEQNRMRKARGRTPFPDYNIVKIAPIKAHAVLDNRNPGTPKRTHNRSGHYRVYKNGKEIWVRPTTVNANHADQIPPGHYEFKI